MKTSLEVQSLETRDCPGAAVLWAGGVVLIDPGRGPATVVVSVRQDPTGETAGELDVAVLKDGRSSLVRLPADAVNAIVARLGQREVFVNTSGIADVVAFTTLGPRGRN